MLKSISLRLVVGRWLNSVLMIVGASIAVLMADRKVRTGGKVLSLLLVVCCVIWVRSLWDRSEDLCVVWIGKEPHPQGPHLGSMLT